MNGRLARWLPTVLTAVVVLGVSKLHAQYIGHYVFHQSTRFEWSFFYIAAMAVAAYAVGLPDLPRSRRDAVGAAAVATVVGASVVSVAQLIAGTAVLPRFVIVSSAALLVPGYALCVLLVNEGRKEVRARDRVVAVVRPEELDRLVSELATTPERSASVVWAMAPEGARSSGPGDCPLVEAVTDSRANVLVLDRLAQADDTVVDQAALLHARGVRVRTLSRFYDEWLGKLPASELEQLSLMFDIGEVHRARYQRVKRVMDTVIALMGCVLLVPVTTIVLLADASANRGPLLYRQPRVGKGGREFVMLKFRTMRPGTDSGEWTDDDDPRVTRGGRVMRRLHIDELPQVVNVLRGELALVGPRPEQPHYVSVLVDKLPFYAVRHLARPGMTGWAQVKFGYAGSDADALEKLQYDFYYLAHQSLTLDLRILGRTLRTVVGRDGR
ncbi:MAG: sugar transferase [Acidimicrobiales bacterium]|nr:sugar transferase [Acidimicrobiales bacterium]